MPTPAQRRLLIETEYRYYQLTPGFEETLKRLTIAAGVNPNVPITSQPESLILKINQSARLKLRTLP